jgi:cation transport regulator ChaB
MPYESTRDLPKAQTDQYSAHQKSAFRAAFNHCHEEGRPEAMCFQIAHFAAKRAPRNKPA